MGVVDNERGTRLWCDRLSHVSRLIQTNNCGDGPFWNFFETYDCTFLCNALYSHTKTLVCLSHYRREPGVRSAQPPNLMISLPSRASSRSRWLPRKSSIRDCKLRVVRKRRNANEVEGRAQARASINSLWQHDAYTRLAPILPVINCRKRLLLPCPSQTHPRSWIHLDIRLVLLYPRRDNLTSYSITPMALPRVQHHLNTFTYSNLELMQMLVIQLCFPFEKLWAWSKDASYCTRGLRVSFHTRIEPQILQVEIVN